MNLASLTQLQTTDPLPLTLGPAKKRQAAAPLPRKNTLTERDGYFFLTVAATGRMVVGPNSALTGMFAQDVPRLRPSMPANVRAAAMPITAGASFSRTLVEDGYVVSARGVKFVVGSLDRNIIHSVPA